MKLDAHEKVKEAIEQGWWVLLNPVNPNTAILMFDSKPTVKDFENMIALMRELLENFKP